MKKSIFNNLNLDISYFFLITMASIALIIWVIQAVNFLDIVSEDGHSLRVYFFYTIYSLPKIFGKILPLISFISIFYILILYENKNELIIFWSVGISKIKLINYIVLFSSIYVIIQLILLAFVIPTSLNKARSYFRDSNLDLFSTLIKEKKFIDTVSNLTIFVESKNGNNLTKVFFKDIIDDNTSQIIFAKNGRIINTNNGDILRLYNGRFMNIGNKKQNLFEFSETEINLSKYTTKTTTHPKIQETSSFSLFKCLQRIKNAKSFFSIHVASITSEKNCSVNNHKEIKQEFFKRLILPAYIPLFALIASMISLVSRTYRYFSYWKLLVFCFGVFIIIMSEISINYLDLSNIRMLIFSLMPFIIFCIIYFIIFIRTTTLSHVK